LRAKQLIPQLWIGCSNHPGRTPLYARHDGATFGWSVDEVKGLTLGHRGTDAI
jgi:hypothetical protein